MTGAAQRDRVKADPMEINVFNAAACCWVLDVAETKSPIYHGHDKG